MPEHVIVEGGGRVIRVLQGGPQGPRGFPGLPGPPGPPGSGDAESETVNYIYDEIGLPDHTETVAATREYLDSEGGHTVVDGVIGSMLAPGATPMLFAPNGGRTARMTYNESNQLDIITPSIEIQDMIEASDFASGGPIYNTGTGTVIMFYHGEEHDVGNNNFWSFIGLATASDSDLDTWTDRGRIITPEVDAETVFADDESADVGSGPFWVHDGYIYVYFKDLLEDDTWTACSVARAPLADFLGILTDLPVFNKWNGVDWSEPALGGGSVSIIDQDIHSRWIHSSGTTDGDVILIMTIHDGTNWSVEYMHSTNPISGFLGPFPLTLPSPNERLYASLLGPSNFISPGTVHLSQDNIVMINDSVLGGSSRWDDSQIITVPFPKMLSPSSDDILTRLATLEAAVADLQAGP